MLPLLGYPISLRCIGINFSTSRVQKNPIRRGGSGFVLLPLLTKDAAGNE